MKRRAIHDVLARLVPSRFTPHCPADPSATMRAVSYARHGGREVLEVDPEHPRPSATRHHLLVRVGAAGLNPVDFKLRRDQVMELALPLPKIPGTDLAGEVVAAPPGSPFVVGDRVFGMMPLLGTRWGACAQYVPVEPRFVTRTPEILDDAEAASLPLVGLTVPQGLAPALRALGPGTPRARRALVQAAAGS